MRLETAPTLTGREYNRKKIYLRCVFFNADVLVGFDILACADGAAGPEDLDCLNSGVPVYAEDGGEFAL